MAEAFAVYSADDTSLRFYKRDTVPTAGSQFEGRTVTAVYTEIETRTGTSVPGWCGVYGSVITVVEFVDHITPISLAYMFYTCGALTSINLNNLNTSNATIMYGMFRGCGLLTSLDLSGFDTSNVTDMSNMFNGCKNLATIYASQLWDITSVASSGNMFSNCTALVGDIPYNSTVKDATYATTDGGYLTYKLYVPVEYRTDFLIRGETLYEIADAVREKTGTTDVIAVTDMAELIRSII